MSIIHAKNNTYHLFFPEKNLREIRCPRQPAEDLFTLPAVLLPLTRAFYLPQARSAWHLCREVTSTRHCHRQHRNDTSLLPKSHFTLHHSGNGQSIQHL